MRSIIFTFFVVISFAACNGPEQNSTVGNSEDSTTINNADTTSVQGNVTDTSTANTDSLDKARLNKALKK